MVDKDARVPETDHVLTMRNRERVELTGVVGVDSFDDQEITVVTDLGQLMLRGEDLHIQQLNLEQGTLLVEGLVNGLEYTAATRAQGKARGGFLDRLFR